MNANEISISTERLNLRSIILSDGESILSYRSSPEVYKYQNWKPKTIEDVEIFIKESTSSEPNIPGTWHQLSIFIKENNMLIGDIGIHFIDDLQVEIGFALSADYQGKGYATEAVLGVMNYLFYTLKKHRVTASVDPRNIKSISLLNRIKMRKEAHFKKSYWFNGEWVDDIVYAILAEEWIK